MRHTCLAGGQPCTAAEVILSSRTEKLVKSSTHLPDEIDQDKLAEAALAILSLTLHGGRVWKGLDWDLMDLLE